VNVINVYENRIMKPVKVVPRKGEGMKENDGRGEAN
jgi:hypothetical protein